MKKEINSVVDQLNILGQKQTGTNPKEKTVAKALKYYVDNFGGGAPSTTVWGNITGDIGNQRDLIDTVDDMIKNSTTKDLSITYSQIKDIPNGEIEVEWINGGICSVNNPLGEGTITTSSELRRSKPILLKKGMILLANTSVRDQYNVLSRVDESNNFISTIDIGRGEQGFGRDIYRYIATEEAEYVCITRAWDSTVNIISVYEPEYNFIETKNKEVIPISLGGFVASGNNPNYIEGVIRDNYNAPTEPLEGRFLRTPFIRLKKGNVLKINVCCSKDVNVISTFNTDLEYVSKVAGSGNSKLHDYNYVADEDCFVIIGNDLNYLTNSSIYFYDSVEEYENSPIDWNLFYVLNNNVTYTSSTTNYLTTNEILLRKGDVLDYYTASRTNNAFKLSIWKNGVNTSGIIQNNNSTTSPYYQKSYRSGYVATEDCFVRILNYGGILTENDVQIKINKYDEVKNANIYDKEISVIGDSYVENQNENIGLTWHGKLACKYGSKYNNYGINGNGLVSTDATGTPVINRLDVIDSESDLVIVIGGKNDYNQQLPINDFKTGLHTICQNLISSFYNKKIAFFTPWNSYGQDDSKTIKLVEYVDAIKEVCSEYSIPVYDSFHNSNMYMWVNSFKEEFNQSSTDISHLNNKGHNRFLNEAEKFILGI